MPNPNWQYNVYVGPPLDEITLNGNYGNHGWELVAVLPSKLSAIPVATSLVVGYTPVSSPEPGGVVPTSGQIPKQDAFPVVYDNNSFTYIFKQPV
jgi:hypothetical protein